MNGDLDARLRRAFAGIDTAHGFEARVAARIAAIPAMPSPAVRERIERERARASGRIAREAWMNAASVVGVGAAAVAIVWRHGAAVARWTEHALAAAASPEVILPVAMAVLAAGLWPVLKGLMPR